MTTTARTEPSTTTNTNTHIEGSSDQVVRDRIRHVLSIYPRISRSMLQVGIGTSLPPAIWTPVLERMIENGEVRTENASFETPVGRHQSYVILQLSNLVVTVDTLADRPIE